MPAMVMVRVPMHSKVMVWMRVMRLALFGFTHAITSLSKVCAVGNICVNEGNAGVPLLCLSELDGTDAKADSPPPKVDKLLPWPQ